MVNKVAVMGGGSFGTIIANICAENGSQVAFWMRNEEVVASINSTGENKQYLPGYKLNERVRASTDMASAVQGSEFIFVAVPSQSFRSVLLDMLPSMQAKVSLVSTTKGIEAGSFLLMSQVLQQVVPDARVGVLSGPNLAKEIAAKNLTGTVIASPHGELRETARSLLKSKYFRVYPNDDMFGVELGGSLKNIYAIIAGIAGAMGMGHNTSSMLITRSLAEMARFGRELGADPMTFLGLSGVGDLIVTCSTPLSRNYRIGYAIGQGKTVEQAKKDVGQTAEGINTVALVKQKADELGVYMPLVSGLAKILNGEESIAGIMSSLMLSENALDVEFVANDEKNLIA